MKNKVQKKEKFEKPELIDLSTTPDIGYGTLCPGGSIGTPCSTPFCSGFIF